MAIPVFFGSGQSSNFMVEDLDAIYNSVLWNTILHKLAFFHFSNLMHNQLIIQAKQCINTNTSLNRLHYYMCWISFQYINLYNDL